MSPALPDGAAAPPATLEVLLAALPEGTPTWILVVSLVPLALVLLTSFARLSIVLAFLRHGLGLQDVPPAAVTMGLAAILALVTMAPVAEEVWERALVPLAAGELEGSAALARAWPPLEGFMAAQTRERDRALFAGLLRERGVRLEAGSPRVLVPAFVLSELKSGFQIGLVIWIPFLVVDLLVALLLSATGLGLEPRSASLPLKLALFVAVDGWTLLTTGLVRSFGGAP